MSSRRSQPPYVAVVGAGTTGEDDGALAEAVGAALAQAGAVLVCGGLAGIMAAACRGAREAGGTTIGLLPGADRSEANEWVDIAIPTGMGEMRNVLVVRCSDAVIAVGGGYGTLSEIAFALKTGVPVVGIGTWHLSRGGDEDPGIVRVDGPAEAVQRALGLVGTRIDRDVR